jgi:diaminohydroxyphosphoribosylaminopyrimidine deaminase / 5-amino-6-(5-phosphoribosylamino)uracil reductase
MTEIATEQDTHYIARALKIAANGLYTTSPNPRVGCVLVKNGQIIAEGWHKKAGEGHAEVEALKQTTDASGATAYVTLEPCSHYGRTPPCCEALISAGVKKVVVAMQDPNPLVAGKGIKKLREAGIEVICEVLTTQAAALNRGFIKRMLTSRPFVCSKLAMSLDGRTALANGESQWITSAESRRDVQYLRAASCAVLTGINTVLADNPSLNVRLENTEVLQPVRIVLDSRLNMPLDAKMATLPGETWLLTCQQNLQKQTLLEDAGFKVFQLPEKNNRLDLAAVFDFLGKQQLNEVLIEAGAILNGALLAADLVDEWIIYMASCVLGDNGRGLFNLPEIKTMSDKKVLQFQEFKQIGADLRLRLSAAD